MIVVDDGSTDRTAEIAAAHGARVVAVHVRQIGAARNAGARVATGRSAGVRRRRHARAAARAPGRGGGVPRRRGRRRRRRDAGFQRPAWGPPLFAVAGWLMRTAGWAAGCFMFVRADVFRRVGGFDERYFASEEIHLSRAVKKHGRFVILRERVITSGRKGRLFTGRAGLRPVRERAVAGHIEAARPAGIVVRRAAGERRQMRIQTMAALAALALALPTFAKATAGSSRRPWSRRRQAREVRGAGRELRRAGRRLRRAAGQVRGTQSVRQQSRRRPGPHRPDRQLAARGVHEEGQAATTRPARSLYGPVNTNTIFAGLNGPCAARNNGDAVVRYDQLAGPLAGDDADLLADSADAKSGSVRR